MNKVINKDEAISLLINDDIDTIKQMLENDDYTYLTDILKESYQNKSPLWLEDELRNRFN